MEDEQPRPGSPPVSWNPPVPGSSWAPIAGASDEPVVVAADVTLAPSPPARSRGRRAVAIGGAVALVAAGAFAVTSIAGGDQGGADSPEKAVEQMVDAMNREDVLGAMDVLLPGERRTLRQPMTDLVAQLRRLEILGGGASLDKVGGTDIQIDLGDLTVDQVADDVADVDISGTASITVENQQLPLGKLIVDELLGGERPSGGLDRSADFGSPDGSPITLATVREGGRWYVSVWYSVAENALGATDLAVPDAQDAVQPDGAATPEGAVDQMLGAISDLDLERAIATLDPNEFQALQRYAPLFLDDAQTSLDDLRDLTIDVADTEYDVQKSGDDRASIGLTSFTVDVTTDQSRVHVGWDGSCITLVSDGDTTKGCAGDSAEVTADQLQQAGVVGLAKVLSGTHPITVERVDGQWYVSVFGSMFDAMIDGLKGLDPGELRDAIDQIKQVFEDGGPGGSGLPFPGGSLPGGDIFSDGIFTDGIFTDDGSSSGQGDAGGTAGGGVAGGFGTDDSADSGPSTALDACFAIVDPGDGVACVTAGLAAGTIAPTDVSAVLVHPECGLAEPWWSYYGGITDEAFTQLVTAAHPCFQELVDAGSLAIDDVPYETVEPECFEGKNPYALEGEAFDAALGAYEACAFSD